MNSPTDPGWDNMTRASTSGASASLRATSGWSTNNFSSAPILAAAISWAIFCCKVMARRWRSFFTFAGICPGIFAARDPSSREYLKIQQRFKFGFGFARETDDEGGAQRHSGNSGTQIRDQVFDMRPAGFTPHPAKHGFVDMLQRDVDVTRHVPAFGNSGDQLVAPVRRMGVKESDPKVALDFFDFAQEPGQREPASGIDRLARTAFFLPQIHS